MAIFNIAILFIIPANILLLFFRMFGFDKKIGKIFSLLIVYGMAPLLSGLIFYYLVWFLPKRSDNLYIIFVLLFWVAAAICLRKKINEVPAFYKDVVIAIKRKISWGKSASYLIILFFTLLFSIQALWYPISENDSAYYFIQSEALYQSKDAHWYESGKIMLNGIDEYYYNKMIRPGIPSCVAFSFLFGQKENNYFMFNFFFVFYYYLLLGMFLFIASRLAVSLNKNRSLSILAACLFFVFYWNMARFYIFNNKEVVIYFLALAGIYLIYNLILAKKRNIKMELLLGAILGLNSFVNLHGILIGIFSLCVLFIFSKLSFWQRVWQVVFIFSVNLFFSAFEFVQSFGFIFLNTFKNLLKIGGGISEEMAWEKGVALQHANMYQANNIKEVYLKGKLQMITNVGSYGFYFLFFLAVLTAKFKEIWASVFGKIMLLFMAIYYLIIIDPLNLNKNNLAIVLWGSPKYSMLVVLFSILVVAIYFDSIVCVIFRFVYKNRLLISLISFALSIFLYIFKSSVINSGLKILQNIVQINRNTSFYAGKIEMFFYVVLSLIVLFGIVFAVSYFMKIPDNIAYRFFSVICLLFMISPFFIVNVGKVPLGETFRLIDDSRETKLQSIIYFGDLFRVYYYAKNNLPKGTPIRTELFEIYTYNDYFSINNSEAEYEIVKKCDDKQALYKAGAYCLCLVSNQSD